MHEKYGQTRTTVNCKRACFILHYDENDLVTWDLFQPPEFAVDRNRAVFWKVNLGFLLNVSSTLLVGSLGHFCMPGGFRDDCS